MQNAINILLTLQILILLGLAPTQAQNNITGTDPSLLARLAPDQEQICTFEPTFRDVFYYKGVDAFLKKSDSRAKVASIQVDYVGNWPQQARSAFEYAMSIWEFHIDSAIPIKIEANWTALEGNTLGSAGPTLIYPINDVWYPIAQASAIEREDLLSGNQFGVEHDIVVNMNSAFRSWYFETDANTPSGLIDFVTVVIHEIGHGLGFTGSMSGDPDNQVAEWGLGDDPVIPFVYDTFIEDGFSQSVLNENIYPNPSNALYNAVTGNSSGLFFIGNQANEAYEDLPVPIYAPQSWQGGSSFSHLDLATFTNTENALMRPQIDNAFAIHSPGPVMCGIFADTGWPLGGGCFALLGVQSIVQVDDSEIDFGVTNVKNRFDTTIVITNDISSENVLVGRVELFSATGSFSLNSSSIFLNIEPGQSQEILVRYLPRFAQNNSGEIRIAHNGVNVPSPIMIPLNGDALEENRTVELEQNYPNPFNASTNISYKLPQNSRVKLEIFDMLGKLVETVFDGEQSRGRHVQRVQADDWSSGVYIYRIIVEGGVETGKLMLVK
ncbi:MAG: T9SS type A sorting domain-containing protein [Balneola sp.]